jgi:LPXTG-motif cell wall-anchored protein
VKVTKRWDQPLSDATLYEKAQVTIRLYANGVDTGRTETVNLKNNWTVTFYGLPYRDEAGKPIVYTVVETWETEDWIAVYGAVETVAGEIPTYQAVITNVYRWMGDYTLPGTGGGGTTCFVIFGLILAAGPFAYGFRMRRRYGRRAKQ